jgi:hypothetical protein
VTITNFQPANVAQVWQLTSDNAINHLSDISFSGRSFSNSLPAQSVTLFIIPAANLPRLRPGSMSATNTFNFWLDGQAGQQYVIQSSTDLVDWQPIQTNLLSSNSVQIIMSGTDAVRFYRARSLP